MKNRIFINVTIYSILCCVLLLISSCKKDDNDNTKEGAVMVLNHMEMYFTTGLNIDYFLISNIGDEDLEWSIDNHPDWISFSKVTGTLTPGAELITAIASLSLSEGTYNGVVSISSNGGNGTVVAEYDVISSYDVGIYPGLGVDDIKIYDDYADVKDIYGLPDDVDDFYEVYEGTTYYYNFFYYNDDGIAFYVYSPYISLNDEDQIIMIQLAAPYERTTDKGIGIGNTKTQITANYGNPESIDDEDETYDYYVYGSEGIDFAFQKGEDYTVFIFIYDSMKKNGINVDKFDNVNIKKLREFGSKKLR